MKYRNINFDLRQLRTFYEVCREESFTRASRSLKMSQPTMSHQISLLEKILGVPLISRSSKDFSLTGEGEMFRDFCLEIFSITGDLLSNISQGAESGRAYIAASTIPSAYLIPPIVASLKREHPGFHYSVITSDSREVVERLKEGSCQAGVLGSKTKHPSLQYKKITADTILLIGPPDAPDSVSAAELRSIPLVIREKGSGTQNALEQSLSNKDIRISELNPVFECSSTESLKESVIAGIGFGFISNLAIEREIRLGIIKKIDVKGLSIQRDFFLVHRSKKTHTKAVALFIAEIEKIDK